MLILGIDPDVNKNGVALWNTKTEKFELLKALDLFKLIDYLSTNKPDFIILEAGWLYSKSNWHKSKNKFTAQCIAKKVGMNHQSGKTIEKFLKKGKYNYKLQKPKGKITSDYFFKISGEKVKNQDIIDAAMLVYKTNINSLKLGA